jgi:serine/threonine-protein kinase
VLFQFLAGRVPYESTSLTELALRQQQGDPEPLSSLNPEVGPALDRAVARSLAPDPGERYRSAIEMREAIEEAASGRDSAATIALETAVTTRLATRRVEVAPPAPGPPPPQPVRTREPARRARRAAPVPARPAPRARRRRRGVFSRFFALLFLFLMIAAIVAGVVVINSGSQKAREFARVTKDTVNEQVDGLRNLIDDATK